jgi:hypothetical protein
MSSHKKNLPRNMRNATGIEDKDGITTRTGTMVTPSVLHTPPASLKFFFK